MPKFEVGDVIGDKAGNKYKVLDFANRRLGTSNLKQHYLLRKLKTKVERWLPQDITESFSELIDEK